jgi:predicted CXXCH cytochrome family protein
MLQPAGPKTVLGDFGAGGVALRGTRYRLRVDGESYLIADHEREHRVEYTLGSRRVQHYLATRPDGRIVVLPPTWDVERREWFHNMEIVNREESSPGAVQVWNASCYGCHVSRQEKGYDAVANTYATRWQDFGTSCERCHGPGTRHLARHARGGPEREDPWSGIIRPSRLSAQASTMICAQCHSFRDLTAPGYTAGQDYYDYFFPVLEYAQKAGSDPAYWADGRPRRFSNDALGLWQSECFLKGRASCTSCHHDPHLPDVDRNPQLAPSRNDLCTRCHEEVGRRVAEHSRHRTDGPGGSCVECHMPATVVSLRSRMRDHAIGVPVPENTRRFGIPNACNTCHQDKDAAWAVAALDRWYPDGRRQRLVARAEAFTRGRAGEPSAVPLLVSLSGDATHPPLVRANAVGYLGRYREPRVRAALLAALTDDHPLVRAVAAVNLGDASAGHDAKAALVAALADPKRIVRMSAALTLINLRVDGLTAEDRRRLEAARADILRRGALHADDAPAQLDLGKLHLLGGDASRAAAALETSLRLDPGQTAARYFLAVARIAQRKAEDARRLLLEIPQGDEYTTPASRLLERLATPR